MAGWLVQNGMVTAVLALAVWALCRWRRLGPVARHALWMVVLIKLLLPTVGAWPWAVRDPAGGPAAADMRGRGTMELLASLMKADDSAGSRDDVIPAQVKSDGATVQGAGQPSNPSPTSEPSAAMVARESGATERVAWRWSGTHVVGAMLTAWLLGSLRFIVLQCARIIRMIRRVGGSNRAAPSKALEWEVRTQAEKLKVRGIAIRTVIGLKSPYVWALFRPVLLWPAEMEYTSEAARGMIVHELAHIKRRDHWAGWLMLIAGCIWWWNPVYWRVCREIRESAEFACDAWAVRQLPTARRTYAEGLLGVLENGFLPRLPLAAGIGDGGRRILELRLRMIMQGDVALRLPRAGLAAVIVMALASLPAWAQEGGAAASRAKFTLSKETTAITSPLNADGTPDYVGALNAKYSQGVTPENNGFVAWLGIVGTREEDGTLANKSRERVLEMCGATPTPMEAEVWRGYDSYLREVKKLDGDKWDAAHEEMEHSRLELWKREQHADFAAYLSGSGGWMDRISEAVKRPKWWWPAVSIDEGKRQAAGWVMVPRLGNVRRAADELGARATMRAEAGDFDGFLADILTIKRLSRHMTHGPTVLEGLLAAAINHDADDALGTMAGSGKLTAEQCDVVRRELAALPAGVSVVDEISFFERWIALDNCFWVLWGDGARRLPEATGGNSEDGVVAAMQKQLESIQTEELETDVILMRTNQAFDGLMAEASTGTLAEMRKRGAAYDALMKQWTQERNAVDLRKGARETKHEYSERVARALISMTAGNWGKAFELMRAEMVRDELADVLLAAAKERARTGRWPATLEELVPGGMKEVPGDFFSEGGKTPVRYVVTEDGAWVYSVGMDGVDGGGRSSAAKRSDDIVVGEQE